MVMAGVAVMTFSVAACRFAGKTRPGAAGVTNEFVLILETRVSRVDEDRKYLVLRVDSLFLSESGEGDDDEYEGKKCLFHRNRKFGRKKY